MNIEQLREKIVAESATGCRGAGDYRAVAQSLGFERCEVYDWTSSAGDWTFLVSEDGFCWRIMSQTNRWPLCGFEYHIDDLVLFGTFEEVCKELEV